MQIDPQISILVDKKRLTVRQLEALVAISKTRSQTQASKELGISTPVLHRYIKRAEKELGFPLIHTTHLNTGLTPEASKIIKAYKRYILSTARHSNPAVACTPITQNLLLESLSGLEKEGRIFDVYIGDDRTNLRLLDAGTVDLVIFDDPLNVYEYEGNFDHRGIGFDSLIHVYRSKSYVKFRYGAQRIGFEHLKSKSIEYCILHSISDVNLLFESKESFFINQSLVSTQEIVLHSETDASAFTHEIIAMVVTENEDLYTLVEKMKKRAPDYGFIT